MKRAIIFDTNIVRNTRWEKDLNTFITHCEKYGDLYVPRVVIDELSEYFLITFKEKIRNYKHLFKLFNVEFHANADIEDYINRKTVTTNLLEVFNNKIINLDELFNENIYERVISKKPPFDSKGDAGFKDTLIWLSLIDFDFSNFDEVIFLTRDKDFTQNRKWLLDEFSKKQGIAIQIIEDLSMLKSNGKESKSGKNEIKNELLIKGQKDNINRLTEEYSILTDYRNKLNEILDEISFTETGNMDGLYLTKSFVIYEKLEIGDLNEFLSHIVCLLSENIMSNYIDPYFIFKPFIKEQNFEAKYKIELSVLIKLIELIDEFLKELPKYETSFIQAICDVIMDNNYEPPHVPSLEGEDDLPF